MSKIVHIESPGQYATLIQSSTIVVTDFYADWCGPCKAIAPLYEQLSSHLSRPNKITFTKVNTDHQKQICQSYGISAMPTFLIFKNGRETTRIRGADAQQLSTAVKKLAAEAEAADASGESSGSGVAYWLGAELPRAYIDVTDQVDVKGLDLLNSDSDFGNARTLFQPGKPSALGADTGKKDDKAPKDWVESDTDEQLMFFVPFQATLKIHSLHITSVPSAEHNDDAPMRPKTIKLYTNRAHVLGFEEADDTNAVQTIELKPADWDQSTGTAKVDLRFVKFQNVSSLVLFVVDGEGDGEKTRLDRLRFVGETGEKKSMGKLEKIGADER